MLTVDYKHDDFKMRAFCVALWFFLVKSEFELSEYDILYELLMGKQPCSCDDA